MRGVAPQATHSFRDHSVYGDMHYPGDYHPEMRSMQAVDDTLSRMRLNPLTGASSDLQTFIRCVSLSLPLSLSFLINVLAPSSTSMSGL